MLEAHIVSPRGSLYYAGEAHPYDLEMLWQHVRDAANDRDRSDVNLEIVVHDDGIEPAVAKWIRRIARAGVRVQLLFARRADSDERADAMEEFAEEPVRLAL
jgi:hypothetical protein